MHGEHGRHLAIRVTPGIQQLRIHAAVEEMHGAGMTHRGAGQRAGARATSDRRGHLGLRHNRIWPWVLFDYWAQFRA